MGQNRVEPVLGASKNPKNNFWDFWTPLKPDPGGLDPSPIYIANVTLVSLESPQAALHTPYLRSSGWTTYLFTISYLCIKDTSFNWFLDSEHEARMKEIEANHKNAMKSIQTQSELESDQHKAIMTRIIQQRNIVEESGKLDGNQFLSKASFINDYLDIS